MLAGHSFGGLYVLAFAARYPDEVAGMVLVDPTAPAADTARGSGAAEPEVLRRVTALLSSTSRLAVSRLCAGVAFGELPPRERADVRASVATSGTVRSTLDEYAVAATSTRDAAALQDFGDKPLFVLTAGVGSSATWVAAQNHLATLSTDAVHRVVAGAAHQDLVADARYAAGTAQAITAVVTALRAGQPLAR